MIHGLTPFFQHVHPPHGRRPVVVKCQLAPHHVQGRGAVHASGRGGLQGDGDGRGVREVAGWGGLAAARGQGRERAAGEQGRGGGAGTRRGPAGGARAEAQLGGPQGGLDLGQGVPHTANGRPIQKDGDGQSRGGGHGGEDQHVLLALEVDLAGAEGGPGGGADGGQLGDEVLVELVLLWHDVDLGLDLGAGWELAVHRDAVQREAAGTAQAAVGVGG